MQSKSSTSKKAHEIRNPAFAFGVYGSNSKRIADVAVTDKGLVWSNGKASKEVVVKWDDFINFMQSQLPAPAVKKAPAAKKAPAKAKAATAPEAKAAAPKAKAPAASKVKKATKSAASGTKRTAAKKASAKSPAAAASEATMH